MSSAHDGTDCLVRQQSVRGTGFLKRCRNRRCLQGRTQTVWVV